MVGEPFVERERNGRLVAEREGLPTYDELALVVLGTARARERLYERIRTLPGNVDAVWRSLQDVDSILGQPFLDLLYLARRLETRKD